MASLLPPEGADPGADPPAREMGSRVGLVASLALALAIAVGMVLIATRSNETTTEATVASTPTVTVTPTLTAEPAPTISAQPQPTSPASGPPGSGLGPFTGGQTPTEAGSWIADVRTAGHDGYDRVVFEFTDVVPTFQIAYADPPFIDTAGTEKPVAGAAFLDVWLEGTSTVQLDRAQLIEHYPGPDRVSAADTTVVTEIVDIDDFESNVHWTIGLTAQQPVTVTTLDNPGRLVIDVSR